MVALAIGIWHFRKLPERSFRALVVFLALVVCVEWYGKVAGKDMKIAIGMVYNFAVPIEYMFYVWFLAAHLKIPVFVKLSWVFIFAFSIFMFALNLFSKEAGFHGVYMRIGIIGVLLFCSFFFYELLNDEQIVNPLSVPVFWICCGLFIFNLGEFVYGFGIARLAKDPKAWIAIFRSLNSNLNVVLYSCISVALVMASWRK